MRIRFRWYSIIVIPLICLYIYVVSLVMSDTIAIRHKNIIYAEVQFCVSDMIGASYLTASLMILLIFFIILIYVLKVYFRNSVMIKQRSRMAILANMYRQCIIISLLLSTASTVISTALSFYFADCYLCNWNMKNSYEYINNGVSAVTEFFPTWGVILLHFVSIFMMLLIAGAIIILAWFYINPVVGVVVYLLWYGVEMRAMLFNLLFTYIDVGAVVSGLYFKETPPISFILAPLIILTILIIISLWAIKRKDLFC